MYSKRIRFEDYNGVQHEQTFQFNMTETELTKMQYSPEGNFQDYVQKLVETKNEGEIINLIEKFVVMSYGEKSTDGQRFIKVAPDGHKLGQDFIQTEAYNVLFMELATNADAAIEFITGIMPAKVRGQITPQQISDLKKGTVDVASLPEKN